MQGIDFVVKLAGLVLQRQQLIGLATVELLELFNILLQHLYAILRGGELLLEVIIVPQQIHDLDRVRSI